MPFTQTAEKITLLILSKAGISDNEPLMIIGTKVISFIIPLLILLIIIQIVKAVLRRLN